MQLPSILVALSAFPPLLPIHDLLSNTTSVPDVSPYIKEDLNRHSRAPIRRMLRALLNRALVEPSHQPAPIDGDLGQYLRLVNPIAEDPKIQELMEA